MSAHRIPNWLQHWLGLEAGSGEGALWSVQHRWTWPHWLTLVIAMAIVAWVVGIYLREGQDLRRTVKMLLASLRLAVIGLVLVMIAQLAIVFQRTGLPYVAVVIDDSLSMTVADRLPDAQRASLQERLARAGFTQSNRWNVARMLLLERDAVMLKRLSEQYKLRLYYLTGPQASSAATPDALAKELRGVEPTGKTTRLGAGLTTVLSDLRGSPPAAIVLLSDGINTDGPPLSAAASLARRKGVPLFTVGIGDDKPQVDLRLTDLLVDDVAFVNDVLCFEFKLSGAGLEGRKVQITLHEEGKRDVLAKIEATVGPEDRPQTLRLPYRPSSVGRFRYVVEAAPQEGEANLDNNRQTRTVDIRKDKIRLLLVQGYPNYEYRYLRNLLARDQSIELHTLLQEADVDYAEQGPTALRVFPVRRDELFAYDVLVLGDVNPALLSPQALQNVADFVTQPGKGGALIAIAGPRWMPAAYRDTPLASLLPIDSRTVRFPTDEVLGDGFHVQPTELGLSTPAMQLGDSPAETAALWKNLPPLYWSLEAWDLRPGARVLAEDPARQGPDGRKLPLIAMQYVGAGRVLMHLTDETWRWRYRLGDVLFARYWVQTIRYLTRAKLSGKAAAELTVERREYQLGEPVRFVRFVDERQAPAEDQGVTVVVEHEGHPTQRLPLSRVGAARGLFETVLTAPGLGRYHAWLPIHVPEGSAPDVNFSVVAPPSESQQTRMDVAELRRAARETKGKFYTLETASTLLEDLPEGRQVPIESLPPKTLWNRWPLLFVLLALLAAEWLLRKQAGLV